MQMDTVIIGGGPVGLYTAFRLGLVGIENCVLEILDDVGGQCSNLYKDKEIYDLPGIVKITAGEFINHLVQQVNSTGKTKIVTNANVVDVKAVDGGFTISIPNGLDFNAKSIVITTGAGAFEPRKPNIKGLNELTSGEVMYSIKDKSSLSGRDVVILGGGDSALDWAVELENVCRSIKLVHRSPSFRANSVLVQKVMSSDVIQVFLSSQVSELKKTDGKLLLYTNTSDDPISADHVVICYGMVSSSNAFNNWSIALNLVNGKLPVDSVTSETSIGNVFAAGDISFYDLKKCNLISGFSQSLKIATTLAARG